MSKLHWFDVEELAVIVTGIPESEADTYSIEEAIFEKFECNMDTFSEIAQSLVDFTIPAQAGISGKMFKGFVKDGAFIAKVEFNPAPPEDKA